MPLAFLIIGIALAVTAFRGTYSQLFQLLGNDFSGNGVVGQPSFLVWIGAIIAIGLIGFVPKLEGPSRAMLGLVFLVLLLANKGFFANLAAAFQSATPTQPAQQQANLTGGAPITITVSSGGSGSGAQAASALTSALGAIL